MGKKRIRGNKAKLYGFIVYTRLAGHSSEGFFHLLSIEQSMVVIISMQTNKHHNISVKFIFSLDCYDGSGRFFKKAILYCMICVAIGRYSIYSTNSRKPQRRLYFSAGVKAINCVLYNFSGVLQVL